VHGIENQQHAHAAWSCLKFQNGRDILGLYAGNEVGDVHVGQAPLRNDLGVGEPGLSGQGQARLGDELDLRRAVAVMA
jgi:hypothetical protein